MRTLLIFFALLSITWARLIIPGENDTITVPLQFTREAFESNYPPFPFPTEINGNLVDGSATPGLIPGNIVLARRVSGSVDKNIYYWQSRLPKAIIFLTAGNNDMGTDECYLDCWSCLEDFQYVPFASISPVAADYLFKKINGSMLTNVTLTFEEKNPFRDVISHGGWLAGQIILELMALASLVISVLKFIQFQKFVGFQFNIAQVSLLILILASCLSIINWINPYSIRKLYPSRFFAAFMLSPSPLVDAVTCLIILYWYELITLEAIRASSFVGKLIVPFFVVSLFFIALDYAVAITRSVYVGGVSNDVLTSQVVISMILYTALAIFYVVISVRTIRSLLKSQNGRTKRTMRTSILLGASAFGLVIRVGAYVAAAFDSSLSSWVFNAAIIIHQFGLLFSAISYGLSFQPQNPKHKQYSINSTSVALSTKSVAE